MLVLSLPDVEGPENELRQDKKVAAPVLSWCIHQGRYGTGTGGKGQFLPG